MENAAIPQDNETPNIPIVNTEIVEPAIKTILKAAPDDKREEVIKAITIIQQESFSGPIPHPSLMAGYEQLLPGSADRILKMAELQQAHRFSLESSSINSQLKSNRMGQIFGFILSFLVIIAGIVLFILNMPILGVCLIAGMVFVLAILFLRGQLNIKADLKNKKASVEAHPQNSNTKI